MICLYLPVACLQGLLGNLDVLINKRSQHTTNLHCCEHTAHEGMRALPIIILHSCSTLQPAFETAMNYI